MEKYAKLMKGLEMCAGPECCKDGCPYYGETRGGKTCRARLLMDAGIAINNEQALHESAEEEIDKLREQLEIGHKAALSLGEERDKLRVECEELKDYARAVEEEGAKARRDRDEIDKGLTLVIQHRDELAADKNALKEENKRLLDRCQELRDINSSLRSETGSLHIAIERLTEDKKCLLMRCQGKTDQSSVSDDALKSEYKRGYLDAMEYCFRELCQRAGGGGRHE